MAIVDLNQFSERLFTPLFYELQDCKTRYLLNFGGSGSSKSYSQHQLELINLMDDPKFDTLMIRKNATTLYDSCYKLLENIAESWGVKGLFKWTFSNAKRQIMHPNGHRIVLKGLDDPEKIKSIAGIKRIIIEEASELEESDFTELMRRVRGIDGIQIVLLFNPISETHWIKKLFFDSGNFTFGVDLTVIKTTYLDNPFLTKEDLLEFDRLKKINYNQYRVYALGQWGVLENGNPWLYGFDFKKRVSFKPLGLIQNLPVHLSFDFNINPITAIAGQHSVHYGPGSFVHLLREYVLPNTAIGELCKRIKSDYPFSIFTATGDATGRGRNAGYESGSETLWDKVKMQMRLSDAQILTPPSNPSWRNNRFLCNALMQGHQGYKIDPGMTTLINDCLIAKPVEKPKNPREQDKLYKEAGNSTYGMHVFDNFRYYNNTHFSNFAKNPFNNDD